MTGLRVKVRGADFEANAIGFSPAAGDGLRGMWLLNTSVDKAKVNLARDAATGVYGTPEVGAGFLRFKGFSNFFETDIAETEAMTILAVARTTDTLADAAHVPMYVSNFGSSSQTAGVSSYGVSMYPNAVNTLSQTASRLNSSGGGTAGGVVLGSNDNVGFNFLCGRIRQDRAQIDNITDGVTNFTTSTLARVLSNGRMRIGGSHGSGFQGLCDLAAVAIYSRYITDAERDAMYEQIKTYEARRWGIQL